ncbi:long-chain-fatty-acid--CoA ligase [Nesterenkonia sp. CL21]|uniref:long-chain-fatty-acid--CoA ligase n=1 Tax=Nesterenkonia sp. CL21 TaxID=3064894 RepID=UPI0028784874|nr:long-chain-fatty-acid--CoA ligase [Nesterenkonia sp. CL21]MDS2173500.1 long-chain-fatty-acid--CoA ligase [Nesterenkonia sp. CL21]
MINHGLGDWIHRRRVRMADRPALFSTAGDLTYGELASRIDRLAQALAERGVRPGDRVAYLGENAPSVLECLFAAGSLGAVFVPLNTRLAPPELAFQLQDSGARTLVCSAELGRQGLVSCPDTPVERVLIVGGETVPAELEDLAVEHLGAEDSARPVLEAYEPVLTSGADERPQVPVAQEDLAVILYTSGTTGRPKGAMLSHGNLHWNALNVITDYDITSRDVALMISPLFHVAALSQGTLPVLLKGGAVILETRFDPGRALRLIREHGVTNMSGVPTTYQMLCEHPDWESTDLSSLRTLTCGGSAVPARVLDAYEDRGMAFTMGYGLTETAPGATMLPPSHSRAKQGSAGLPHFHTDVRVVRPDGGRCAPGEVGEILVQGPNVVSGYWNRPDATAAALDETDEGTWLHTGDMGHLDEEGFLYVTDRLKDMIISGGENIYPAQVEQELAQLDAVAAVAVIGVEDDRWGEVPRAVVVVREGHEITAEEIIEHLQGRLARYKIPKSVVFVEDMPRTASGKIRKPALRELHA